MKPQEIDKFYAALAARIPLPKTELEFKNPYTLLVAVVLSAQATDAGVNKATRNLFKTVDTPAKMLKLGEEGLKKHIRTIGLFNTKAKNVIALSHLLIERHGGEVPEDHDALEALPGVGRKTANVVRNVAFGHCDHRGRYACVPRRQSHRPGQRRHAREGRDGVGESHARQMETARPSLADPARPSCVQGAQTPTARPASCAPIAHSKERRCFSPKRVRAAA